MSEEAVVGARRHPVGAASDRLQRVERARLCACACGMALSGRTKMYVLHADPEAARGARLERVPRGPPDARRLGHARGGQLAAGGVREARRPARQGPRPRSRRGPRDPALPRRASERHHRARDPWPRGPAALAARLGRRAGRARAPTPARCSSRTARAASSRRRMARSACAGSWSRSTGSPGRATRWTRRGRSPACSPPSRWRCELLHVGERRRHAERCRSTPAAGPRSTVRSAAATWSSRSWPRPSEGAADLIVMATEGHQGFLDAIRGSTTERVLRQAPCPVLAVPALLARSARPPADRAAADRWRGRAGRRMIEALASGEVTMAVARVTKITASSTT